MKWTEKSYLDKQLKKQSWEYRKKEWRKNQRKKVRPGERDLPFSKATPTGNTNYEVRKYQKPASLDGYIPSKGGPLKCKKHPDPEYHEQVKKLYRTTSKLYTGEKS